MKRWLTYAGPALALALAFATPFAVAEGTARWLASARWMVEQVDVIGVDEVPTEAVLEAAGLHEPRHLFTLRADRIQARVEALPLVRSATVSVRYDGRVQVAVEERSPAGVVLGDGAMLVDIYGEAVRPFDASRDRALPFVVAADGRGGWSAPRVARALELARRWDAGASRCAVAEIHDEGTAGWRLVCGDGVELRLADDGWEERMSRMDDALARARETGREVRYVHADGALDQVVLGWEDERE